MNSHEQVRNSLNKGIRFILDHKPGTAFKASDYTDEACREPARSVEVVFPLGLLLNSLSQIKDSIGELIPQIGGEYDKWVSDGFKLIKKEEGTFFSINYWIRGSKYFKELQLPDDLDDTALIIAAYTLFNKEFDQRYFLKILELEVKPGGPYRTWYLREFPKKQPSSKEEALKKWIDIDPAVNAHILYAAKLYGIELRGCKKYVIECLENGIIDSPYYLSGLVFLYYSAKYASIEGEKVFKNLIKTQLCKYSYSKLSPLNKIFFSLIQLYIGEIIPEPRIAELIKLQNTDGAIASFPLFNNYQFEGRITYIGSPFVSTSYFIEMLALIYKREKASKPIKKDSLDKRDEFIVKTAISQMPVKVRKEVAKMIYKNQELFWEIPNLLANLIKPVQSKEDKELIAEFISILTLFSTAYTYLDYVIDKEASADKAMYATILLKQGSIELEKLKSIANGRLYNEAYAALEITDRHYLRHGRAAASTPSYKYISERMNGYIKFVSMLPTLLDKGVENEQLLEQFLKSLLIIKQLNDDAHDWKEDLKNGRDTFVTAWLNKLYKGEDTDERKKIYWKEVSPQVIKACDKERKKAVNALGKMSIKSEPLSALLNQIYQPVADLKEERIKVERLTQYFKS